MVYRHLGVQHNSLLPMLHGYFIEICRGVHVYKLYGSHRHTDGVFMRWYKDSLTIVDDLLFIACQHTDARYRCSNCVRLSVRQMPVFYGNGLITYCYNFFITR